MSVVQNYITVGIQYSGVKLGLYIGSHIGDGSIGSVQLIRGGSCSQSSQSDGLSDIRVNLSVDLSAVGQGGKAKVQQVIVSESGADYRYCLYCHNIHGILNGRADGRDTAVGGIIVPVADRSAVIVVERRIIVYGGKGLTGAVQCGSIGGYHLEGGTRLTHRVGRTV